MKKIFLTAAAVFAFSFANAQDVKFGAKAGLNMTSIAGDTSDFGDVSSKIGFQVGVFAEIKISDKFAIQPELLYSAQGAKASYVDTYKVGGFNVDVNVKATQKLAYLNIPVMAKYFVAEGFSLEAGLQIGFLMSANREDTKSAFGLSDTDSYDNKELFNSTDFAFNVGAGYDITENINLGLRYSIGLSNILKDSGDNKINNSNFALALGYKF
jgi:long-subunit fatty acid transport protein